MTKGTSGSVGRRDFLKTAAAGTAAVVSASGAAGATEPQAPPNASAPIVSRDAETGRTPTIEAVTTDRPGSDFMVDVVKSLGFEYVFSNPANTFRSLHESIVNYGGNQAPEFITCCHEEIAAGMAHGYAKIEGKPALVVVHGTVGTQHASMAVYDAFCDRVPVFLMLGNHLDAAERTGVVTWAHSAQDVAAPIRDYIKWDDTPASLTHFAESTVRAYKIAMTPPMMPVAIVADAGLQEHPLADGVRMRVPKYTSAAPPQGDSGAVLELAKLLVAAENPVLGADRLARTPAGLSHLIELADTLQAAVVDQKRRMNFPTRHPLDQSNRAAAAYASADLVVGLEVGDFAGVRSRPGAKRVTITANDLFARSNYQEFQRLSDVDLAIAADAEATMPSLIEAVKRLVTDDRRRFFQDRGAKLAKAHQEALESMRTAASYGWDASPISTARMSSELWAQIKDQDWSLVSDTIFVSWWPLRLWTLDKHHHYIGDSGGYGVGYGLPAAVGAALANKKRGRLSVNIQNDGDLMFVPGALWTAAHHRIPLLTIMHNNRAYHQEVMEVQKMALQHGRGATRAHIGTKLDDPPVDYAKLAQSMGVHGEGPISDPKDLGPAIRRAVEVVKRGEPALVDVLTQPR
jgi:thiamine pyrophosphate-dependent acetolactate synthase large subunit-like protein